MKQRITYELNEEDLTLAVTEYLSRRDIYVVATDVTLKVNPNNDIIAEVKAVSEMK